MHKCILVPAAVLILLLSMPTPVRAEDSCTGIACLFSWNFGFTERAQINADARVEEEKERTEQKRIEQAELTDQLENNLKYNNDLNVRLQEVNRLADTKIAEAQSNQAIAEAQRQQYVAMVENWRMVQMETIRASNDQALAALHGATDLGLKSLEESGRTKRFALAWDSIWAIICALGVVLIVFQAMRSFKIVTVQEQRRLPGHRPRYDRAIADREFDYCEGYLDEPDVDENDEVDGQWYYEPKRQIAQQSRGNHEITYYNPNRR